MTSFNRLANLKNPYQESFKKVLCVCSAGLLRSPTAAWVLSGEPFNFNTRAAGIEEDFALISVDDALVLWADEIVCMEKHHADRLYGKFPDLSVPVIVLGVPDSYSYRDPELVKRIHKAYEDHYIMAKALEK